MDDFIWTQEVGNAEQISVVQSIPLSHARTGSTPAANLHLACFQQTGKCQLLTAAVASATATKILATCTTNLTMLHCCLGMLCCALQVMSSNGSCVLTETWTMQQLTLPDTVLKASSYFFICTTSSHLATSPFFQSSTFRCTAQTSSGPGAHSVGVHELHFNRLQCLNLWQLLLH